MDFSPFQVEQLIEIATLNGQVGMIIGDPDVHQFYATLLAKYANAIQPNAAQQLTEMVKMGEPPEVASNSI
jgi:hypothetical protein